MNHPQFDSGTISVLVEGLLFFYFDCFPQILVALLWSLIQTFSFLLTLGLVLLSWLGLLKQFFDVLVYAEFAWLCLAPLVLFGHKIILLNCLEKGNVNWVWHYILKHVLNVLCWNFWMLHCMHYWSDIWITEKINDEIFFCIKFNSSLIEKQTI